MLFCLKIIGYISRFCVCSISVLYLHATIPHWIDLDPIGLFVQWRNNRLIVISLIGLFMRNMAQCNISICGLICIIIQ